MARPKTQIDRKSLIVQAAKELFAMKGVEKTTIEEIAKQAGIGKGSVYLEFKNKDDMYFVIVEEFATKLLESRKIMADNSIPPHLDTFKKLLIDNVLDVFDMAASQMQTYVSHFHTSYQIKRKLAHVIDENLSVYCSLLKKASNNNEIPEKHNYMEVSRLMNTTLQGFIPPYDFKYALHYRPDTPISQIRNELKQDVTTIVDIILSGIKAG
jgi:AcrR family transcriptional regulator